MGEASHFHSQRLRFEFYVIIIRESPFPKYLELEVEKTARVLCMTLEYES